MPPQQPQQPAIARMAVGTGIQVDHTNPPQHVPPNFQNVAPVVDALAAAAAAVVPNAQVPVAQPTTANTNPRLHTSLYHVLKCSPQQKQTHNRLQWM
jgi:hypothetical protein